MNSHQNFAEYIPTRDSYPSQLRREKPCFMCLSVLGLRTSRGGRGRDPKHLQPFDRGRSFKLWPACWTWYQRLWKPCLLGSLFEGLSTFCGNHQVKSRCPGSEGFGAASVIPLTLVAELPTFVAPGDTSSLEVTMAQTNGDPSEGTATISNQMAQLVPSFDPSKDDLEQYKQKVELLSEIWPENKVNEMITRLILNTTGSAFQKLQLNRAKLITGDKAWIQLLISLLGGQWGKVSLEKTYEIVEKALFKCVQRQDESNDSFLARCDVFGLNSRPRK